MDAEIPGVALQRAMNVFSPFAMGDDPTLAEGRRGVKFIVRD
jgi:hypothetical protein